MPTLRPLRSVSQSTRPSFETASSTAATSWSRSVSSAGSTSISFGVYVTPILTSTSFLLGRLGIAQRRLLGAQCRRGGFGRVARGLTVVGRHAVPPADAGRAPVEREQREADGDDRDRAPLAPGQPEVADVLPQEVLDDAHGAVPDGEHEDEEAVVALLAPSQPEEQRQEQDARHEVVQRRLVYDGAHGPVG